MTSWPRSALILATVLAGLFVSVPASAVEEDCRTLGSDEETGPVVCRERHWFHQGGSPVGNIGHVPPYAHPSWSATPPSGQGAVTIGESYVGFCPAEADSCVNHLLFVGTFEGNIDSMAISLFAEEPTWTFCRLPSTTCATRDALSVALSVDGTTLYETEGSGSSDAIPIDNQATSQRLDLAFADLHEGIEAMGRSGPDIVHHIRLRIAPNEGHAAVIYRYDSSEFPSGLIFNPTAAELAEHTIVNA